MVIDASRYWKFPMYNVTVLFLGHTAGYMPGSGFSATWNRPGICQTWKNLEFQLDTWKIYKPDFHAILMS